MGRKLPSLFGTRKYRLKKPSSRSDWGTSSIAPLRRREDGSCCSTEAFEVLLTTVWWTPSKRGGLWPNWIVYSRTELCGEPKMIPLVDAPIRERNAIEEAECCILDVIPVLGCQKGPGGGRLCPSRRKVLGILVHGLKSCGRKPNVSPITRAAGDRGTSRSGRKTDESPDYHPEIYWRWRFAAHQNLLGGCGKSECGEWVRTGQKRLNGLALPPVVSEETLLILTGRSGATQWSWSGRPIRLFGVVCPESRHWLLIQLAGKVETDSLESFLLLTHCGLHLSSFQQCFMSFCATSSLTSKL